MRGEGVNAPSPAATNAPHPSPLTRTACSGLRPATNNVASKSGDPDLSQRERGKSTRPCRLRPFSHWEKAGMRGLAKRAQSPRARARPPPKEPHSILPQLPTQQIIIIRVTRYRLLFICPGDKILILTSRRAKRPKLTARRPPHRRFAARAIHVQFFFIPVTHCSRPPFPDTACPTPPPAVAGWPDRHCCRSHHPPLPVLRRGRSGWR